MTSHLGPFRITSVEHPSKKALKRKADLKDVHKVYFEDADGFDSAYFPYAEPEKQGGGAATSCSTTSLQGHDQIAPRLEEPWTREEILALRDT
jgi:hypothetical protein